MILPLKALIYKPYEEIVAYCAESSSLSKDLAGKPSRELVLGQG